jgi:hypothetical protein
MSNWRRVGLGLPTDMGTSNMILCASYSKENNTTPSTMFNTNILRLNILFFLLDLCNPDLLLHL